MSEGRRGSTTPVGDDEAATAKGSRSPYARIRTSFVAKFGNLLSPRSGEGNGGNDGDFKSRRKSAMPKPVEVDPVDLAEIRTLVQEGLQPETRRGALLGLFKISLREDLLEALVAEGSLDVLVVGLNQEPKGSGARRAAMQTIRNLAARESLHGVLVDVIVPTVAPILGEEIPGSGPLEAALEALSNISSNVRMRQRLVEVESLVKAIITCVRTEPQGMQGKQAALKILENISQAAVIPVLDKREASQRISSRGPLHQKSPDGFDEESEDSKYDIQEVIDVCLDITVKEPKGSASKVVAMKTLKNVASSKHRDKVAATANLYETILSATREDSPGSETRWLAFALFSELADELSYTEKLMKTANLVSTVVSAVRDEATGSPSREYAMLTVAHLCKNPESIPTLLTNSEDLIGVCARASTQEAAGSGGRAAALEACAAFASLPEYRQTLLKSLSLISCAVESAYSDASVRVRLGGLDLLASLAQGTDEDRQTLFKTKHAAEAVLKALDDVETSLSSAALTALRGLCRSPEIRKAMRKEALEKVLIAMHIQRSCSKGKLEALRCLEEGLYDQWSDPKLSYELIERCAYAMKNEAAGSEATSRAASLLMLACKNGLAKVVADSGIPETLVTITRELVERTSQSKIKTNELYSRTSLRRVPTAKASVGSIEQVVVDCELGLKLLTEIIRGGIVPPGVVGPCQSLLTLSSESEAESASFLSGDALSNAVFIAVSGVPTNSASAASAKEAALILGRIAIKKFTPQINGAAEESSITRQDILEVLCILSNYGNVVESEFKHILPSVTTMLCETADNGERPRVQEVLCTILLNCLFVHTLADLIRVSENRSELDQALIRIANRGGDDYAFSAAGRAAQAIAIGLKIIHAQSSTVSNPPAKVKQVSILCARDGLLLAKKCEDNLKKLKNVKAKVAEGEWFNDKSKWDKIAIKQRKNHIDAVVSELKSASIVVICASNIAEIDPVIHMLSHLAISTGINATVCTGIETTSHGYYGTWIDSLKSHVGSMEAHQLCTWSPLSGKT